jgi:hypothetical protein
MVDHEDYSVIIEAEKKVEKGKINFLTGRTWRRKVLVTKSNRFQWPRRTPLIKKGGDC